MRILNRFTGETIFDIAADTLQGADLCDADLRDADLRSVDLQGANLRSADLCDADLCDADLCDADLRGANLQGAGAVVLYGLRWPVIIVPGNMRIGCKVYTAEAWENFTDKAIDDMDSNASVFWAEHKEMLLKLAKRANTFLKEK